MSKSGAFLVLAAVIGCLSALSINQLPTVATSADVNPGQHLLQLTGTANCGTGDIRDVRLTGCTSAPCQLRRGDSYNIQVDFAPTGDRDFGTVFFKSITLKDNQIQTVTSDVHLPNVHLYPGVQYTFNYDFTIPTGGPSGSDSELRLKVYQNLQKPLCLIIPATIQ